MFPFQDSYHDRELHVTHVVNKKWSLSPVNFWDRQMCAGDPTMFDFCICSKLEPSP